MKSIRNNFFNLVAVFVFVSSLQSARADSASGVSNGVPYNVTYLSNHISGTVGASSIDMWFASDHVAGRSMSLGYDIYVRANRIKGTSFCGQIEYVYDLQYNEIYGQRCGEIFIRHYNSIAETQNGAKEFLIYEVTYGLPPDVAGLVRSLTLQNVAF